MWSKFRIFAILLAAVSSVEEVHAANHDYDNFDKELVMTYQEKAALDKFKNDVSGNITEPELMLMKSDLFLLRFVRAKNLDVDLAKKDLFEFLKFAHEINFTKILEEDWSDMEETFPIQYDFVDKQLRPIMYVNTADGWNVRATILQGKAKRLRRYFFKMAFEVYTRLIETGKKYPNVTQQLLLFNVNSFVVYDHACVQCIYQYLNFFERFQRWIPGYVHEFVIFNAPDGVVYLVLQIVRSFISNIPLKVLGSNKKVWMTYLEQKIDKDVLRKMLEL